MAGNKYDKYFLKYKPPPGKPFIMGPILQRMDTNTINGSNFYFIHWVLPHEKPRMKIGHPPHIHQEAELLIHIGTNPDDPDDLGAEVELCMGPELEKHIITTTTVVFIPPNFIHAPGTPSRPSGHGYSSRSTRDCAIPRNSIPSCFPGNTANSSTGISGTTTA